MNSLDKMEDYDRLKQERDELAAQIKLLQEKLSDAMEWNWLDTDIEQHVDIDSFKQALSITPSVALREIQARTLEEALEKASCRHWDCNTDARILEMIAAKRKGE